MKTKLKYRQGFTIIEVMIVLAIAGLIMLIVFLAVPALQRSSRNTTRKSDAGNFSSALNTWISNNNGTLPGMENGQYTLATCNTDVQSIASSIKLGYYTVPTSTNSSISCAANSPAGSITVCNTAGACTGSNSVVGTENMVLAEGVVCSSPQPLGGSSSSMVTSTGAGARNYVVLYAVETGGAPQGECIGG